MSLSALRGLLEARGVRFGVTTHPGYWKAAGYSAALDAFAGCLNAEVVGKMDVVQPGRAGWNFGPLDAIVERARLGGQEHQLHTLIWWTAVPQWLWDTRPAALLREMLRRIVVMTDRYGDASYAVYALNEIWNADGEFVNSPWLRMGPEYPRRALEIAAEMAPGRVGYNGLIQWQPGEKVRVLELAREGLIQYVGCQYHLPEMRFEGIDGFLAQERPFWEALDQAGVMFEITEMDVRLRLPATAESYTRQAQVYAQVVGAALRMNNFKGLHLWGLDDGHSWVPGVRPGWGEALLLDRQYQPKLAYERLVETVGRVK